MKRLIILATSVVFMAVSLTVFARETNERKRENPFACLGEATDIGNKMSTKEIKSEINKRVEHLEPKNAQFLCVIAELMKRVGDYRAEDYYKKAIGADDPEPAYELFFADYLRNFRGPQRPLFPEAEEHYYETLKKLGKLKAAGSWQSFDDETRKRVERGLITLYQEDGFPLLYRNSNIIEPEKFLKRPLASFSTINKYEKSTTDFDGVDDVRDFTSEALFSSSKARLNRPLTEEELKRVSRRKEPFETLNRLRFRYNEWPVLDLFYKHREIDDAQIANFFEPTKFDDVNLNEYGVSLEKPFNFSPYFDFFLKGIYKRTKREGLIEFLPDEKEDINHYEAKAAVSRFFGPDKVNLEFTYVFQDIDPDILNPPKRDRQIFATTFTFLRPLYELRFETRGLEMFSGVVYDKERFGGVDVKKNDYFVGASLKGFKIFEKLNTFDVAIQPTIFTSDVEGGSLKDINSADDSQDNSQYRTNVTLLYRILDEEKEPGIPRRIMGIHPAFCHLVIPFRHDIAIDGNKNLENFKIGIELDVKFFIKSFREKKLLGATFLTSLRYDYQRFYRLDRNLDLFSFNISMGF